MAYVPRETILAGLEDQHHVRLLTPETIHTTDLQALWALIESLQQEVYDLMGQVDELEDELATRDQEDA